MDAKLNRTLPSQFTRSLRFLLCILVAHLFLATVAVAGKQYATLKAYTDSWVGTPYVYGKSSRSGTDCSGYIMNIYKDMFGVDLPHRASMIYDDSRFKSVGKSDLKEGDLVFAGEHSSVDHIGIFMGDGIVSHASSSKGVMYSKLNDNYWKNKYKGARRLKSGGIEVAAPAKKVEETKPAPVQKVAVNSSASKAPAAPVTPAAPVQKVVVNSSASKAPVVPAAPVQKVAEAKPAPAAPAKKVEEAKPAPVAPAKKTASSSKPRVALKDYTDGWIGTPYIYGKSSRKGTDGIGYVANIYKDVYGVSLPGKVPEAFNDGRFVSIEGADLKEGDLVFFGNAKKVEHIGVYMGDGTFTIASSGRGVKYFKLSERYWNDHFKGARRLK